MASSIQEDSGVLSLYLDTNEGDFVDLEVAASAAIEWSRALKIAALTLDKEAEYRISLVAAKPGSSNWIAKIEKSKANQALNRTKEGWENLPFIARVALGLAVAIPTTIVPTIDYWIGNDGFSDKQKQELTEIVEKISENPEVKSRRRSMYREVQKDPKIIGIGTGVPDKEDWRPEYTVPANQFAEADGLFDMDFHEEQDSLQERVIQQTLDVILVSPQLENAARAWTFRQEGLPGTISATMKDKNFLLALENSTIKETLRSNIPMKIILEIKQQYIDGEWKVKRRGRSVLKVLYP